MALQAYYQMNNGWTDSSGNAYDGTNNGAVINNVDQKLGDGCGQFATNDFISFSSYYNPSGLAQASMDGWIKKATPGSANQGIYGYYDAILGGFILTTHPTSEGIRVYIGTKQARLVQDISTDWIYVAIVFDGSLTGADRLKLYVNSVLTAPSFPIGTPPATIPTLTTGPMMGKHPVNAWYYSGLVDDMAFYSHALTQAYIDERWNGGAGREISSGSNIRKRKLMEMSNA